MGNVPDKNGVAELDIGPLEPRQRYSERLTQGSFLERDVVRQLV